VHAPAVQRWPAGHGEPVPHAQWPVVLQRSLRTGSQRVQAAPPTPQLARPDALQVEPEQQPLPHVAVHSAHEPPTHAPLHV
jgi:hypothetical protein